MVSNMLKNPMQNAKSGLFTEFIRLRFDIYPVPKPSWIMKIEKNETTLGVITKY
jgi:hypothetical protein